MAVATTTGTIHQDRRGAARGPIGVAGESLRRLNTRRRHLAAAADMSRSLRRGRRFGLVLQSRPRLRSQVGRFSVGMPTFSRFYVNLRRAETLVGLSSLQEPK